MSANSSEMLFDFDVVSRSKSPKLDDDVEIMCQELETKLFGSNDEPNLLVLQEVRKTYEHVKSMKKNTENVLKVNRNLMKMNDDRKSENKKLKEQIDIEREDAQAELNYVINKEKAKRNDWMIENRDLHKELSETNTEVRDFQEDVRSLKEQLEEMQHLKNRIEAARHKESALLGSIRKMHRKMDKMLSRAEKAEEECAELSNALEENNKAAYFESPTLFEEQKMKTEELQNLVLSLTKSCNKKDKIIAKFENIVKQCDCFEENMEFPKNDSMAHLNGVWKFVMTPCQEDLDDEEHRKTVERSLLTYNVSESKHTTKTKYEGKIIHQTRTKIGKKTRHSPDETTKAYVKNGRLIVIDKYLNDSGNEVETRTETRFFDNFLRVRSKIEGIEKVAFFRRV